ncbi:hypothetical protein L6452_12745 [Arctium lappa]|uniref:Uncharacterized protein n=1 Tax=Arctium lappa TaxID=4217 RepID=A0ACB9CGB4_ARCLA|nr:hypothetical protein L6452_12745 [Arctium lappa]
MLNSVAYYWKNHGNLSIDTSLFCFGLINTHLYVRLESIPIPGNPRTNELTRSIEDGFIAFTEAALVLFSMSVKWSGLEYSRLLSCLHAFLSVHDLLAVDKIQFGLHLRRSSEPSSSSSSSESSSSDDDSRESRRSKRKRKDKRHRSKSKHDEEADGPLPLSRSSVSDLYYLIQEDMIMFYSVASCNCELKLLKICRLTIGIVYLGQDEEMILMSIHPDPVLHEYHQQSEKGQPIGILVTKL